MANGEAILYTIPGSITCQKAEDFLKEAGVRFKVISIGNVEHLESVGRDIEAQKLPLLLTSESRFEGLKAIMSSGKESK